MKIYLQISNIELKRSSKGEYRQALKLEIKEITKLIYDIEDIGGGNEREIGLGILMNK